MANNRSDLVEGRKRPAEIERIVARANEKTNSMHDEIVG
jgi:hypothetical protein